jgi:hypothetical protein
MRDGYWDFLLSSKASPVLLMLEFIWTKLSLEFDVGMPWGDDLELERLNEFLKAKPVVTEQTGGWVMKYDKLSNKTLNSRDSKIDWEPIEVTAGIFAIFHQLTTSDVNTTDPEFVAFADKEAGTVDSFINSIVATNYAAFDGVNLSLITENLTAAVVPDGRFLVAENNSGRFEAWLKANY